MLSDGGYYKMSNGDYTYMMSHPNAEWCDQPETSPFGINPPGFNYTPPVCSGWNYMILPKNKEGIVVLDYSLTDNTYLDPSYTVLEAWDNGITQLNSTIITSGSATKTLFIPPSNHDRNITVFASWKWYTPIAIQIPVTNITINKFEFYTMDTNTIDNSWVANHTYELENYCGVGSTIVREQTADNNGYTSNITDFIFGDDINGLQCGLVKLDNLIIARHWTGVGFTHNYYYYTPNLFFFGSPTTNGFFEEFLRTRVKFTWFNNYTWDDVFYSNYLYDNININVSERSLQENYSNALRQTISLINNPSIQITTQTPTGNNFKYSTIGRTSEDSPYHPFFSSSISIDNAGWYCSDISNQEGYILGNGTEINIQYCGDYGCNADHTHCNFGFIGSYCDSDTSWIHSTISGIDNSGTCYRCVNKTLGNIDCQYYANGTITHQCIDSSGNIADCSSVVNSTQSINPYVNPANYVASLIGGLFGITDINIAETISSIIFSLLGGILMIALLSYTKVHGAILGQIFIISELLLLVLFTFIGWFPAWLYVCLLVVAGLLVSKSLKVF
jgi:hypothetical protein